MKITTRAIPRQPERRIRAVIGDTETPGPGREAEGTADDAFVWGLAGCETLTEEDGARYPEVEPEKVVPTNCTMDLTHACQMRCRNCLELGARNQSSQSFLSLDTIRRILTAFAERGGTEVGFYGGEPLLHPHFSTVVSFTSLLPVSRIKVVTNGLLLVNHEIRHALEDAGQRTKVRVRVSLNAGSEATHYQLHGVRRAFPQIVAGMEQLQAGSGGLKLGISFLVDNSNAAEVLSAYRITERTGGTAFFIRPQTDPHGIGVTPLEPDARHKVIEAIREIKDIRSDIRLDVPDWFVDYLTLGKLPNTQKPYRHCYFCAALRLVVTPPEPGMVWACGYFRSDPRFFVADLSEVDYASAQFEENRVAAIRRIHPQVDCRDVICNSRDENLAMWKRLHHRSRSLAMAEQFLHLGDVYAGIEE